ncbi:hypothetical protein CYMTET_28619 [Cymbomonas tetramitiformis]|uniref:Fatty acid hydroxylase domain-containing protein n=1 Tax=Cymbomonas tetramitiformis TaxID=36881 RepID=A0AAE0KVR8_9CHLO|nr:hypothetical protein CYMTET_28619 [Cymbomonas tetramitiformis]
MDGNVVTGCIVFGTFMSFVAYQEKDSQWEWWQAAVFSCIILAGLEGLNASLPIVFGSFPKIPVRGKHLDEFEFRDKLFICFNKISAVPFMYHLTAICLLSPAIKVEAKDATYTNTVGAFVALFVVYDFFYSLFHRFLHLRSVYSLVHKHHHRQHAPTRGNSDAVNVHPFEFVMGEYNHLLAVYLVSPHMYAALAFITVGGVLASLNHTRANVVLPGAYDVKAHDLHHRIPQSNYGQYIMMWDHVMGSFRDYTKTVDARK